MSFLPRTAKTDALPILSLYRGSLFPQVIIFLRSSDLRLTFVSPKMVIEHTFVSACWLRALRITWLLEDSKNELCRIIHLQRFRWAHLLQERLSALDGHCELIINGWAQVYLSVPVQKISAVTRLGTRSLTPLVYQGGVWHRRLLRHRLQGFHDHSLSGMISSCVCQ